MGDACPGLVPDIIDILLRYHVPPHMAHLYLAMALTSNMTRAGVRIGVLQTHTLTHMYIHTIIPCILVHIHTHTFFCFSLDSYPLMGRVFFLSYCCFSKYTYKYTYMIILDLCLFSRPVCMCMCMCVFRRVTPLRQATPLQHHARQSHIYTYTSTVFSLPVAI